MNGTPSVLENELQFRQKFPLGIILCSCYSVCVEKMAATPLDIGGKCMRQYQMKETKEIKKIICNKCGREIQAVDGYPREGVFSADCTWGYFSEKDGEKHSFDLCESCYDELIGSFQIPVEIEE